MKLLSFNPKIQEVKLQPDNYEDLALLCRILCKGDILVGKARRKIEISEEGERPRAKIEIFNATIQINSIKFQESSVLHASGMLQDGKQKGKFQSISVDVGCSYFIKKRQWQAWEIDKIKQHEKATKPLVFIGVEQDEINFFVMGREIKHLAKINYNAIAKDFGQTTSKWDTVKFFKEIQDLNQQFNFESVVVFGPGFWKEIVAKSLEDKKLHLKIFIEGSSSGDEHGLFEIMRQGRINKIEKNQQQAKEFELWETFLGCVGRNEKVTYGLENLKKAIEIGAVENLLISQTFLRDKIIVDLIQDAEKKHAKIFIISHSFVRTQLDGFGGVAAFLRWNLYS